MQAVNDGDLVTVSRHPDLVNVVDLLLEHGSAALNWRNGRLATGHSHSPLVTEERRARIQSNCALIAERLRRHPATMPSQGELAS
jgi:hypothetical protein